VTALGSKCGNDRIDSILHANTLRNQLGMDTISAGNAIAWAMECFENGLLERLFNLREGKGRMDVCRPAGFLKSRFQRDLQRGSV
jgi:aldehyde:ferredoxin oxidoreductase